MLDVDHFKPINDEHGHAMGDRVLAALGRLFAHQARRTDLVGRWGGEEFVVVLAGAAEPGARIAAERIRSAVEKMSVLDDKGQRVAVTVSIGIACLEVRDNVEVFIDRADRAMYQAKAAGRNRVAVSPSVLRRTGPDLEIPKEIA
jgi:diguanylate cyclase (GGDEF)-like protein